METDKQINQYDELAIRHNAAMAAFRSIYEAKLPPPVAPEVERESLFIPIALLLMIVASVIVSGSRTIMEFGVGLVGVMAFVMLEGAIIVYAFYRTRRHFNEARLNTVNHLANAGLALAFVVTVGANVHAVFKESGTITAEWINTAILIMLAISAPTLAFISGDILAVESKAISARTRQANEKHAAAMREWQEGFNAAWSREKARWGVSIQIENERPAIQSVHMNSLNEQVNEQARLPYSANSSTGYSKRMDARSLIHEYFEQHPDQLNARLDELVVLIEQEKGVKVGRTSIHNVRKEIASK